MRIYNKTSSKEVLLYMLVIHTFVIYSVYKITYDELMKCYDEVIII